MLHKSVALAALAVTISFAGGSSAMNATPPQECTIRESAESLAIWTEGGLELVLNRSNGYLRSVNIGEHRVRMTPRPLLRFEEVVEIPGAPNLLPDSSPSAWGVAPESADEGWLRVRGSDKTKPARTVQLNQKSPAPLILSGTCRYEEKSEESGWMNRWLALNIVGTYADGTRMPEQSAYFGQYDHGPQFNRRVLCPDKPLKQAEIGLTGGGPNCTAWFKDVSLKQARYLVTFPQSECIRLDQRIIQEFAIKSSAVSGLISYQPCRDHIAVRCNFRSEKKSDRAVSAYLAIPFDAVGGKWHDDVRRSRTIEPGHVYRNEKWYGAGRDGYDGKYPLACVETRDGAALGIAVDIGEPRVFQIEYDADKRELRMRFDIGLSPDAGRWANRGSFTAYLFTCDARDGFRGAADRFRRIFDWAFVKRVEHDGMWIPFVTPEAIPGGCEDFNIRFVEAQGNMGWEQANGMYPIRYVEPWIHHQSDADAPNEEARGPADPMATLKSAERLRNVDGVTLSEDNRQRYASYLGSYITDNWGCPQGYFFRQAGRKENMMIVNPNPSLPPPDGANYSSGGCDMELLLEGSRIPSQWHINGWAFRRASDLPFAQIDTQHKTSGEQSIRFDPARSKSWTEQYARGIDQVFYHEGDSAGTFELSYSVMGKDIPTDGSKMHWSVTFWYPDHTNESFPVYLQDVSMQWKRFTRTFTPRAKPFAISVGFGKYHLPLDLSTIWLDGVTLTAKGSAENLLVNGDFEQAQLMPCRFSGIYLDTMECYLNNLNYRRSHWPYAEECLTFDSARKPALQQQFSHITFAKHSAEWAHRLGAIAFANCIPATCFGAPYLDAMGGEEFWMPDGKWSPKSDAEFSFVRFMCGPKPWTILQYSELDAEHFERYMKRCAFYGVYASKTYGWTDPVFVALARPIYKTLMPVVTEINKAGWQPLTLASSNNPDVWLERYGDGSTFYLTVFNPTDRAQSAKITLDERAKVNAKSRLTEMVSRTDVPLAADGTTVFDVTIAPEDLKVIKVTTSPSE